MSVATQPIDPITERCRSIWTAGDFGVVARTFAEGAAEYVNRQGIQPGDKVLDIACGTGNQSVPAAKLGAQVTGVDIAPNLLEQARANAREDNLPIHFDCGNVEALPYADETFDVAISMFGIMFAPRQEAAAMEAIRVLKPGGRIALANWATDGFIGDMFRTVGKHIPPPPGASSPLKWGSEAGIRELFGDSIEDLFVARRIIQFDVPVPVDGIVDFWRDFYGPTVKAFQAASADPEKENALAKEFMALWASRNQGGARNTVVDAEYIEVRAIKR